MDQQDRKSSPGSIDERRQGPTSLEGAEASELPDHGRGSTDTDRGKEAARKTPAQTGGVIGGDVGVRAFPESADAADHGPRGKN
jgi:hypothetical protein